jgi:hypothetical protein
LVRVVIIDLKKMPKLDDKAQHTFKKYVGVL